MNKKIVLGLCSLLLAPLLATAANRPGNAPSGPAPSPAVTAGTNPTPRLVPEIDASSGTQAFALVLGAVLLSAEYIRRRRPSKGL